MMMSGDTFHASQTRERARADAPQVRVCVSGQRVMHAGGGGVWTREMVGKNLKRGVFWGLFFFSATLERERQFYKL